MAEVTGCEEENNNELPEGWIWTNIGYVTEPSKEKVKPLEINELPYVGLEHIEKDTGRLLGFGKSTEVKSTKSRFYYGDLLYGKLRPYLNKVHLADFDGICSTDILVFPKNRNFLNKFLAYRLMSNDFVRYASRNVSGVQHPRVNFNTVSQFGIALPPFQEQQRIVSKIEQLFTQLDAGVEALNKIKKQLKPYRQSVLKSAFEGKLTQEWREKHKHELEPASELLERVKQDRKKKLGKKYKEFPLVDTSDLPGLPDGWIWTSVGEVCEMMQYGTSEKARGDSSGIPVLRMGNIQNGKIVFDDLKYFPKDWPKMNDFILQDGDVLFNRTNSAELVGKTATYKGYYPKSMFASYLIRVKTLKDFYYPDILSHFINSVYGRKYINSVVSQQVGQANVNGTKLASMPIPLIPVQEQRKIIEEIDYRLSLPEEMNKIVNRSLKQAQTLRQSILKKAFEGKLVPQDPNDEPASVLLERIKEEKKKQENNKKQNKNKKKSRESKASSEKQAKLYSD